MQLRERRLGRGWSQEQLAERAGVSVRTIQRIENGQPPGLASATALATAFGVDVEEIVGVPVVEPVPVSFAGAIRTCLVKYADFTGRAGRAEYWWFVVFVLLVCSIATLVHEAAGTIALLLLALPLLAAGARRLHDTGHSGWWQLFALAPVAVVVPLIMCAMPAAPHDGDA